MCMLMLALAIVFTQAAAAPSGPARRQLAGQVTDHSGAALADVRVIDGMLKEVATGSDGRYALADYSGQVRFLKSGYRPVTKGMERSGILDVVLEPASEAPWSPPVCAAKARGTRRIGQWMQFTVPTHLRVRRGQDIDYRTESIAVGGAWMAFGAGPLWSYGFPPSRTLAEMVRVEEREVKTPRDGVEIADYRGVRPDGSRWRTLVMFGESITYERADLIAAVQFDAIIASLCFATK